MHRVRAAVLALFLTGCASTGPAGTDVRYLVETADYVARVESRLAALWPGYWGAGRPFIVYHPGEAVLLVADGPAPEGFTTLERAPASLRGRAHVHAGRLRGLDGNIDLAFRVGTHEATAVPYRTSPGVTLHILFHEAFHATQARRFREWALRSPDDGSSVTRPEITDLMETERRLIVAALEAARPVRPGVHWARRALEPPGGPVPLEPADQVRRLALDYLAVRGRRTAGLPEEVVAFERHEERFEGTATQVEFEATLLALGRAREEVGRFLVRLRLAEPNAPRSPPDGLAVLDRRAYGTGAAMGVLLDRLGVAWREDVEGGSPLDLLLARAVGFGDLDAEAREQRVRAATERVGRRRPGHAAARMREAAGAARAEENRLRVDVEIPVIPGGRRPRVAFNTPGTLGYAAGVLDGSTGLADLGTPTLVSVVGDGVSLVTRGLPVWLDLRDSALVVVRILFRESPTIDGVDLRGLVGRLLGPVVLQGAGVEARFDAGGAVTVEADRVVVRVGKP